MKIIFAVFASLILCPTTQTFAQGGIVQNNSMSAASLQQVVPGSPAIKATKRSKRAEKEAVRAQRHAIKAAKQAHKAEKMHQRATRAPKQR